MYKRIVTIFHLFLLFQPPGRNARSDTLTPEGDRDKSIFSCCHGGGNSTVGPEFPQRFARALMGIDLTGREPDWRQAEEESRDGFHGGCSPSYRITINISMGNRPAIPESRRRGGRGCSFSSTPPPIRQRETACTLIASLNMKRASICMMPIEIQYYHPASPQDCQRSVWNWKEGREEGRGCPRSEDKNRDDKEIDSMDSRFDEGEKKRKKKLTKIEIGFRKVWRNNSNDFANFCTIRIGIWVLESLVRFQIFVDYSVHDVWTDQWMEKYNFAICTLSRALTIMVIIRWGGIKLIRRLLANKFVYPNYMNI